MHFSFFTNFHGLKSLVTKKQELKLTSMHNTEGNPTVWETTNLFQLYTTENIILWGGFFLCEMVTILHLEGLNSICP